jgi:hypothetical protein
MKKSKFLIVGLIVSFLVLVSCQQIENPASDFVYEAVDDSKITITGYIGKSQEVVIPKKINKLLVSAIGSVAFQCSQLTSVSIPNSVTSIGDYAFNENKLTSVIILKAVTSIGNFAFDENVKIIRE